MTSINSTIRFANDGDVVRMLEIYAPFIKDTAISFETVVPTVEEFRGRFDELRNTHAWLVCEVEGQIAGYAYSSPHRSRCAYSWSADVSVYVDSAFHRKNVGRSLYQSLFGLLRKQGFCNVFGGITLPNPASVGLHETLGFSKVGIYKNVGYKQSKWHDVIWYQLELKTGGVPCEPTPINLLFSEQFGSTELLQSEVR